MTQLSFGVLNENIGGLPRETSAKLLLWWWVESKDKWAKVEAGIYPHKPKYWVFVAGMSGGKYFDTEIEVLCALHREAPHLFTHVSNNDGSTN